VSQIDKAEAELERLIREDPKLARDLFAKIATERVGRGAKCSSCGRAMAWAQNEAGKSIPLDLVAPVYDLEGKQARRLTSAYVTHFATCPFAARHSKGGQG
jgi:hypothetical protein